MKYILSSILSLIFLGFLFTGCANKASVSCPSCTIETKTDASGSTTSMSCTECKVEAQASQPRDLGILPSLPELPNKD